MKLLFFLLVSQEIGEIHLDSNMFRDAPAAEKKHAFVGFQIYEAHFGQILGRLHSCAVGGDSKQKLNWNLIREHANASGVLWFILL